MLASLSLLRNTSHRIHAMSTHLCSDGPGVKKLNATKDKTTNFKWISFVFVRPQILPIFVQHFSLNKRGEPSNDYFTFLSLFFNFVGSWIFQDSPRSICMHSLNDHIDMDIVYNNIQYIYNYYIMLYIFSGGGYVYCGIGYNDFFKLSENVNFPNSSLSTPLSLIPFIFLPFGHFPLPIYLSFFSWPLYPSITFSVI